MIYFNAKKLEGVLQEIYSSLIMFNIASFIANSVDVRSISTEKHAQNKKKEAHEVKANFALAITNIRLFLKGRISESGLIDRIKKYVIPIRPGRSFPRKMKPQ